MRKVGNFVATPFRRTVIPQVKGVGQRLLGGVKSLGTKEGRGILRGGEKGGVMGNPVIPQVKVPNVRAKIDTHNQAIKKEMQLNAIKGSMKRI